MEMEQHGELICGHQVKCTLEMEHGSNGSVALGLALISLRGTKESLTEVVTCSTVTLPSCTTTFPGPGCCHMLQMFQMFLKNLTSTPPTSISPTVATASTASLSGERQAMISVWHMLLPFGQGLAAVSQQD